jgi:hypothetical protein
MANFYVAKVADSGNDSNNGTSVGTPKLTVQAALNASSVGDTVYIRKGVYTDTWPYNKVAGRIIRAYQGENVTIDMQGLRNGLTADGTDVDWSVVTTGTIGGWFIDLNIVNYVTTAITVGLTTIDPADILFENCTFVGVNLSGTKGIRGSNTRSSVRLVNCTFTGNFAGVSTAPGASFNLDPELNCLFKGNTYNHYHEFSGSEILNTDYNAYDGSTQPHGIDTTSLTLAQIFNAPLAGDFSLLPTSGLRGTAKFLANFGASFDPRIYVDAVHAANALSAGVNDDSYYDAGMSAPGPDGPVDAGPAVFTSGIWKIDNVSVPGAKSARVHFGPFTLPAGSRLTCPGWSGLEDLTPSSGSRSILSKTNGTPHDAQISINGGSKQLFNRNSSINTAASTVDFYITLRADGV